MLRSKNVGLGMLFGLMLASVQVYAAGGTVESLVGDVKIERPGKAPRPIATGSAVESGDTLITGANSSVSLNMQNGESMIIRHDSRFVIDTFKMPVSASKPATGRSFYSLLKGGLRFVTHSLGSRGLDSYRINTPVATIGIRGTIGDLALDDGLYAGVEDGAIEVANEAGSLVLNAGEYGFVANAATAPSLLSTMPGALGGGIAGGAAGTGTGGTISGTAIGLGALGLIGLTAIIIEANNNGDDAASSTSTATSTR